MAIDVQPNTHSPESRVSTPASPATPRSTSYHSEQAGKWWKRVIAAAIVLTIIGASAPFIVSAVTPQPSGPKLTHTISRGDLIVSVTEQGRLESSDNTEIKCKVKGGSTVLWVIESGTEVKPGDELVRLDTSTIEDTISQQKISYQTALATYVQSQSDVELKKISIEEYLKGTFRSELKLAESNVAIAEENLRTAKNTLKHADRMFRKGYVSKLQLEGDEFSVRHAELELEVRNTELEVLVKYTKAKQVEELQGQLKAAQAKLGSDEAALKLEKDRLERAEKQLENCVINAETSGMVLYAQGEKWEDRPEMREGATVREDQVLLLIPNLDEMQVKVQIHEAKIDQIKPGLPAQIELQTKTLKGEVHSMASVAQPAGWWNGNMVKYDTTIKLATKADLRPGMSADVKVFLAQHKDVLTIPVGAVLEQEGKFLCWVKNGADMQRRELDLGDSDEQFIVVKAGVEEGEEVVVNPLAYIEDAQKEALRPYRGVKSQGDSNQGESISTPAGAGPQPKKGGKPGGKPGGATGKPAAKGNPAAKGAPQIPSGEQIIKTLDKNGDGVLTKDEFAEKERANFDKVDVDKNGKVDAKEISAAIKAALQQARP